MVTDDYRLPDGRIVRVDVTAAKGLIVIDFQLEDGSIVKAERVGTFYDSMRKMREAGY